MDNPNTEAHDLVVKAREALRRGDKETARNLGEQAALLAPNLEDAWLILTAADPNPEDALAYAQQALEINPASARALKAVEWAMARLKQAQAGAPVGDAVPVTPAPVPVEQEPPPSNNRNWLFAAAAVFVLLLCAVIVFSVYAASTQPAFASLLSRFSVPTEETRWAPMDVDKPSVATSDMTATAQQVADTLTAQPTQTQEPPTQEPPASALTETAAPATTDTATPTPTKTVTSAPPEATASAQSAAPNSTEASSQPGSSSPDVTATATPPDLIMEQVSVAPANQYVAPAASVPLPEVATNGNGARWIDVDLTNQRVYAYEGDEMVNSFIVSTGTWLTPTVTGQYKIYVKYRSAPMSGPGYYLPNVPYIMYFYKGYGLHGTYWHNNFGTPMSHGCVNLRTDEAGWLYSWASVGTLVNVHY